MSPSTVDNAVELGHVRDGYPALAAWIACDPDNESFVFRKFDRLSARNLLHFQSQLTQLEREIDELDDAARKSADGTQRETLRRWEDFLELAKDSTRPERRRMKKVDELRVVVKEYRASRISSHIISL
jgi:hypothetical protein